MSRIVAAGALLAALLQAGNTQSSELPVPTRLAGEAEARVEGQVPDRYLSTKSYSYELTQYSHGDQVHTAVVEAQIRHRRRLTEDLSANGTETGTIELSVYPLDASGGLGSRSASRLVAGDEFLVQGPGGVRIITWGCCVQSNAETQLTLHSLTTWYVKSSQMPLLTYTRLGVRATTRVAAVYAVMTPLDDEVLGADASAVAMITWAGDTGPLQRIRFHSNARNPREDALSWMSTIGWKADSEVLSDHAVYDPNRPRDLRFVWQIDSERTIELPLTNERFDPATALLPEGVWIAEMPY